MNGRFKLTVHRPNPELGCSPRSKRGRPLGRRPGCTIGLGGGRLPEWPVAGWVRPRRAAGVDVRMRPGGPPGRHLALLGHCASRVPETGAGCKLTSILEVVDVET